MKKICEICGGSGLISFFQGVSRFLLTQDECPDCNGIGFKIIPAGKKPVNARQKNKPGGKKKSA